MLYLVPSLTVAFWVCTAAVRVQITKRALRKGPAPPCRTALRLSQENEQKFMLTAVHKVKFNQKYYKSVFKPLIGEIYACWEVSLAKTQAINTSATQRKAEPLCQDKKMKLRHY